VKPFAWSLVVTGLASILGLLLNERATDTRLRTMGATGGAVVALSGAAFGLVRRGSNPRHRVDVDASEVEPRFFLEHRRAPRHSVRMPVRLTVNGESCSATLLSVSARGALLRLAPGSDERLRAQVGHLVQIENYPAGTLARIGAHGAYIDFAVSFDAAPPAEARERVLATSGRA
jgi:hypothetical protein